MFLSVPHVFCSCSDCLSLGVFLAGTLNVKVRTLAFPSPTLLCLLVICLFLFHFVSLSFCCAFFFSLQLPLLPSFPSSSLTHSVFLSLSAPPPPPSTTTPPHPLPLLFLSLFPPLTCSLNLSFPFPPLPLLPSFFIFQPLHLISLSVSLPPLLPRPQLFLLLSIPPSLSFLSLTNTHIHTHTYTHTRFQIHTQSLSFSFSQTHSLSLSDYFKSSNYK